MRKILPLLTVVLMFASACQLTTQDQKGYPKRVKIDGAGGTDTIYGNGYFVHLSIGDKGCWRDDSTIVVSYDWLTVKHPLGSTMLIITAQPNETNRKRKLWIDGLFGSEYAEIDVIQGPKRNRQ